MVLKLKIHSVVDLITNSSTVIYTYQDGSLPSLKELVNEMLKTLGHEDKTFDDVMYAGVIPDDYAKKTEEGEPNEIPDNYKELEIQYIKGEIEKPTWMINTGACYDNYDGDTSLHIIPKEEKYAELAKQLIAFLNSPDHEAASDN